MTIFDALRESCAALMRDARFVHIDNDRAERLAEKARADRNPPTWDSSTHFSGNAEDPRDAEALLAYVLILDTINFGSGWFPALRKRPGRSGYFSLCMGLKEIFEERGPLSAKTLAGFPPEGVATLLGQSVDTPELRELFRLSARALRDLGTLVESEFDGSFVALRGAAGDSAAKLVELLGRMPLFRDVARSAMAATAGLEIPFYKRAQIAVSDLALAFGGCGFGAFRDLDALTAFADNTLPHVLRCEGVLQYESALATQIDTGIELASGCPQEIEIRAAAVHAVEVMALHLRTRGDSIAPRELDAWLWNRGQHSAFKARPRHRTRCVFY